MAKKKDKDKKVDPHADKHTGKKKGGGKAKIPGGEKDSGPKNHTGKSIEETKQITDEALNYGKSLLGELPLGGAFGTLDAGTSPEMAAYLARLNDLAQTSGQYTGAETEALDQLRSGLQGYNAPEMQAMREQSARQLDVNLQTALRQQELANARSRVRGAGATAQQLALQQERQQVGGQMEQDLFVKNAQEIQQRRNDFANLVSNTEEARFGRRKDSEALYGGALTGEQNFQNSINQYNNNAKTNEALAKSGVITAGAGAFSGLVSGQEGINQQYDAIAAARKSQDEYNKMQAELERERIRQSNQAYQSVGV